MKKLEKKDYLVFLVIILFGIITVPIPVIRGIFLEYFNFLDKWADKPMRIVKKSIISRVPQIKTAESGDMNVPQLTVIKLNLKINASDVYIIGDFTKWKPQKMIKESEGNWSFSMPVVSGNYKYVFLVDGKELLDPLNPMFDFYNNKKVSVIKVK